jgi:alcohol dehydrogenase
VTHQKMACLDPKAMARVAILDPALTVSQPRRVAACTGIDAVSHAVETVVTKKRTLLSQMYSREAFRLCVRNLPVVMRRGDDVNARGEMLLGASFAGSAIENSMLGAGHSAANPLTAHFNIVHGQAIGLMLPHVVRFNGGDPACERIYADMLAAANIPSLGSKSAAQRLASLLDDLLVATGLNTRLRDLGVTEESVAGLAVEAAKQWTATFNPRPVAALDFEAFYRAAF